MKKKKETRWQDQLDVTVTLEHFNLTLDLVENLAYKSYTSPERTIDPTDACLQLTSIEAYVKGSFHFARMDKNTRIPFTGSYFFTCVQSGMGENRMLWSNSLS